MSNYQLPPQLPPEAPQQNPNYQPYYQPNQNWNNPRPPKKGTSVWKVLLIVFACLIGLGVIANMCDDKKTSSVSSSTVTPEEETNNKKIKTWEEKSEKDPMSDKMSYFASIESDNEEQFQFPYSGGSRLIICVRKSPKYGDDVILKITSGQLLSSEFEINNQLNVRFDDNPAKKYKTVEPADLSSDQLFLRNAKDFIANAKKAKTIRIEVPVFQEGVRLFTYRLDEPLKWEH